MIVTVVETIEELRLATNGEVSSTLRTSAAESRKIFCIF
jgi:hypothetical protein